MCWKIFQTFKKVGTVKILPIQHFIAFIKRISYVYEKKINQMQTNFYLNYFLHLLNIENVSTSVRKRVHKIFITEDLLLWLLLF